MTFSIRNEVDLISNSLTLNWQPESLHDLRSEILIPCEKYPVLLHEMTHWQCFQSALGHSFFALWDAIVAGTKNTGIINSLKSRRIPHRYEQVILNFKLGLELYRPLIEGVALFAQFDAASEKSPPMGWSADVPEEDRWANYADGSRSPRQSESEAAKRIDAPRRRARRSNAPRKISQRCARVIWRRCALGIIDPTARCSSAPPPMRPAGGNAAGIRDHDRPPSFRSAAERPLERHRQAADRRRDAGAGRRRQRGSAALWPAPEPGLFVAQSRARWQDCHGAGTRAPERVRICTGCRHRGMRPAGGKPKRQRPHGDHARQWPQHRGRCPRRCGGAGAGEPRVRTRSTVVDRSEQTD